MISASRIRPQPFYPDMIPMTRECPRCGVDWTDERSAYTRHAPCRDCRDVLLEDAVAGVENKPERREIRETLRAEWRRRPKASAAA